MAGWERVTRRFAVFGFAALAALAATGMPSWAQKKPIKVAGIYTVPVEQQWVSRIHKALKAAEAPTGMLREDVRAELVAKLAADRYLCFKHAGLAERAMMLQRWSRRRGQMIHVAEGQPSDAVPASV